ncbi:MAG TPA: FAD-dependent oxidoreductase [Actinobacteria bacterium]|nr:FAD-dependent oxidoreductase [Actinomycetota bacterium]
MERPGESLWQARSSRPESRAPLPGDVDVDVAIVGAGYTGLWTAFALAETDPSLRIVVVDAEEVGYGASGRNGGWVSAKLAGLDRLLADPRGRPEAVRLQRELIATVDRIGEVVEAEGIDCGFQKGGAVVAATRPPHIERLRKGVELRHRVGFGEEDFRWLDPAEAAEHLRPSVLLGASYTPHCAVVDPLRLVRGLAAAVERRGVTVHEHTRVWRLGPGRVDTSHGTIRAELVVRATEAYTTRLSGHRRDVVPLYSLMVATPPLPPETWEEIGLDDRQAFSDGRRLVIYGQRTDDDRIAFGGRGAPYHFGSRIDPSFDRDPEVFARLRATLAELFPVLDGVELDHGWGGPLGLSRDWLPSVIYDRDTRIAWAVGYAGQGVAAANLVGRILADLVLDRDSDLVGLPIVGHRPRSWEPEPLRWLGINAGILLTVSADRHEERTGRQARWRGALLHRLVGL